MQNIAYVGEHLWFGQLGYILTILAFVSSLFAAYSFFQPEKSEQKHVWNRLGRIGFSLHGLSVFLILALLFYMMYHRMYEYSYVQGHVSDDLPTYYLLSAFWEGQEGSFLLWMFWHSVLGFVILRRKIKWEAGVIGTLCLIEAFLTSMILGLYVPFLDDVKIGSNPFSLLRQVMDAPIFSDPNYLSKISGSGLNPTLQNYWMVIHPPTLFLGFASVSIPFCYAITGLRNGNHQSFLKTVYKWTLFSCFILGLGILMGSAWAYEALTFGGYWAWDPVENTSLVPWLFLIAGVHTLLVARATNHGTKSTYLYFILAFVSVLYSTFLTRSGVLGETSVHAFTEMGLEWQLIAFLSFFTFWPLFTFFKNRTSFPKLKEESVYSREFWMFIGALILFFSGLLMTASTSLPIYNKLVQLYDPDFVGHVIQDQVSHHNRFQIWIGIFLGLLSGLTLFLRFRDSESTVKWNSLTLALGGCFAFSLVLTFLSKHLLDYMHWSQFILFFAGVWTVTCSAIITWRYGMKNLANIPSVMAHAGFGILIIGILITGLNERHITTNSFAQHGIVDDDMLNQAVKLIKLEPFFSPPHWIEYQSDTLIGNRRLFDISFVEVDESNKIEEAYSVVPSAVYSNDFTKIASWNPGTRRGLTYDVFSNVAAYPAHLMDAEVAKQVEDSLKYFTQFFSANNTNYGVNGLHITFDKWVINPAIKEIVDFQGDLSLGFQVQALDSFSLKTYTATPSLVLKNGLIYQFPDQIDALNLKLKIADSLFAHFFTEETELIYEEVRLKEGQNFQWGMYELRLNKLTKSPKSNKYLSEEGDIALGAEVVVSNRDSPNTTILDPIYIIRNQKQFNIKSYWAEEGVHLRFVKIDPATEEMTFYIAKDKRWLQQFPVEIATGAPASNYLVLEAKIIPGINLVWLGCLMMLFGFLLRLVLKLKKS